ncbi:hypothetical protein JJB07_14590 [Tumebacillus sp. ITR2]|uniref:Transcriptional regulator n=1 Tax=Tumebacillus amylolyticus TaxID=2801339 RepID=A0ABS1JC68_9BACL|nr:hypothetical protein [Tumebacillus amylolyticus]MBL0387866.1 hypothetical protein [Tumebacillus amylolyticus]
MQLQMLVDGRKIRRARQAKGQFLWELAAGSCSETMLLQVEFNKARASEHLLKTLACKLDLRLDELRPEV